MDGLGDWAHEEGKEDTHWFARGISERWVDEGTKKEDVGNEKVFLV